MTRVSTIYVRSGALAALVTAMISRADAIQIKTPKVTMPVVKMQTPLVGPVNPSSPSIPQALDTNEKIGSAGLSNSRPPRRVPREAAQPHTLEAMVCLQVRKAHLDLLALVAGFGELGRCHQRTVVIAGLLVDIAHGLA